MDRCIGRRGFTHRAIWRRALTLSLGLLLIMATGPAHAVRVVTYNILNYNGGRISELMAIFNALDADIIVAQEIVDFSAAVTILSSVLNAPGGPGGYALATFTEESFLTNNALYYRSAVFTFSPSDHLDVSTSPRDTDRWRLTLAGYIGPVAQVYVYGMHLKAGSSGADQSDRLAAASLIRSNANSLPVGSHFIFAGDLNIQSSSEASYADQLLAAQLNNNGRAFDPIDMPGSWTSNPSFSLIHTQSTHANNSGAPPGASTGGLDDRFDFLLTSAALLNGVGFDYVPGTYRSFGNDGNHYNDDINDAPVIPEGAVIANALHGASDHLPVMADFQVPARTGVSPASLSFGTVLVGTPAAAQLTVSNTGNLALFGFVAQLGYTLSAPAVVTPPAGSFAAAAGVGGNLHDLALSSPTAGVFNGNLSVLGNGAEGTLLVPYSGTVLAHARPSLDAGVLMTSNTLDFGFVASGGSPSLLASVHNFGHTSLQALLEVYDALIVGSDAGRFELVGGFAPLLVGGTPQSLAVAFDGVGAADGVYDATLVLSTRDLQSLPGAQELAPLAIGLTATVHGGGCPTPFVRGELNGDSAVDIGDVIFLLSFLFGGGTSPSVVAAADVNNDSGVDVGDAIYLLGYLFSGGPMPAAPFPDPGCP